MSEPTKRAAVSATIGALVGALLAIGGYVLPLDRRLSVVEAKLEDVRIDVRELRGVPPAGAPLRALTPSSP